MALKIIYYLKCGFILEVSFWSWEIEQEVQFFYFQKEDSVFGPYISWCCEKNRVDFETIDEKFFMFQDNLAPKKIKKKDSIITDYYKTQNINNQLSYWYTLKGAPVLA